MKNVYSTIASGLAVFALMSVSVASLFYVYNPEPPKELIK
ncbi:cyclic lactone autoinducer peptide [Paenibacillus terrae]|nr:cyclic lactone autoinducer peptide [Paenibacillus terrae]